MRNQNRPTHEDILALVAELVPDIPQPSEIFAEIEAGDRTLWLEGWCDGCIAGMGFPPKGRGALEEKLNYINKVTPEFLRKRAADREMTIEWSGFIPLKDKEHLYGVSWAVFTKKPQKGHSDAE
ncbi:MAG: hypothetical protein JSV94_05040 [Methanobacteriota archaeon]|nr:MAG: hypothetical protein JSV94_05040 [Euryarchaeota archaeon]